MFLHVLLTVGSLQGSHEKSMADVAAFQAAPGRQAGFVKSANKHVAVILIGGLDLRDDGAPASKPRFQSWQGSTSLLVKSLGKSADVFSLAYAQTTAVEEVAAFPAIHETIARIKQLGYRKLVLMGHSAGGLVARHYVEEHPEAGITAVLQIASPNAGASVADWGAKLGLVPAEQAPFVQSLTPAHRTALVKQRLKSIPRQVAFNTIVTHMGASFTGDGIVSCLSQWPRDLQLQGVPCVTTQVKHTEAMEHDRVIELLCGLVHEPMPAWGRLQVFEKRKEFGEVA